MVNVFVKLAGKAKNVIFVRMNAKFPTVMDMVIVRRVAVDVLLATRVIIVKMVRYFTINFAFNIQFLFSFYLVDCLDPKCSGHGHCVAGLCICGKGWKGGDCSEPDNEAMHCLPDCSGHGTFDLQLQQCVCTERWTGSDCSQG